MADQEVITQDEEQAEAPPSNGSLLAVIERAATNPNIDVEKMERLLDMQERIIAREAEQDFNAAMAQLQAELPAVVRDAENSSTGSRYAKLETIARAIMPKITGQGFSLSYGTDNCPLDDHYRVTCLVSHIGGHTRRYHADVPTDLTGLKGNPNKTRTHAFGSTMSYGRRYLLCLIFNVTLVNEDDDGVAAGGKISEEQLKRADPNRRGAGG